MDKPKLSSLDGDARAAVVIGGSIAGLLAARVLSDHFDRVTIVERDRLPDGPEPRKGVPQGCHAHALLAAGRAIMERLFPGLTDELVADGALSLDLAADARWYQPGGYRLRFASGITGLFMTRPFLEGHVLRRVRALANVAFTEECSAGGLVADEARGRVTGVTVRRGAGDPETLPADLVVDASGRGSRAPAWLAEMGHETPEEERVTIGIGYTTRLYERRPGDLPCASFSITQPTPPHETRMGVLAPQEGGRWIAMLGGWLGDHAPADEEGFLAFARSLSAPDIHDALEDAKPLGEAAVYKFPANLRRHYERLVRVPEGYLVTGDALCSFNPVYGQGMSVSALEAEVLEECLREDPDAGLPLRFYRRAAKVIDTPWQLATGADLAYPEVEGERTRSGAIVGRYFGLVMRAATRDERVCRALIEVTNLISPPTALFHPAIVVRVLRAALGRRKQPAVRQAPEARTPEAA